MAYKIINSRAQVTIFVIVAAFLVAVIILLFFVSPSPRTLTGQDFENPESFVGTCLRDSLRRTVTEMIPQGGFVSPQDYKIYNDVKATYLCKNINLYEPCIIQHPLYISSIEEEIRSNIAQEVEQCFINLEDELKSREYEYTSSGADIEITLSPGSVQAVAYNNISLSRSGVSRSFSSFTSVLKTPLYDIASVAQEIAAQEAKFCYFEYAGHNVLYKEFDIKKYTFSDSTKIYTIAYKKTGDEMNIAIRGCAVPAGF